MRSAAKQEGDPRAPVPIPEAIQPHGVLLVLEGKEFRVTRASANCQAIFGKAPETILGNPVAELVPPACCQPLLDFLQGDGSGFNNPFLLQLRRDSRRFDAIAHRSGDRVILELEPGCDDGSAVGSDRYLQFLQKTLADFEKADSINAFCQAAAAAVFEFTGFDRVMVYQFANDGHGVVVAEVSVPGQQEFLGLHFPAGDIPEQARNLYKTNWLRLIPTADYEAVPLAAAAGDSDPIDLTHAVLRSVSPSHREYLRNMGVAASMSISLVHGDRLWGLILCHHRSPRPLPYTTRTCAVMLATVFSAQLLLKERALADATRRQLQGAFLEFVDGLAASPALPAALQRRADLLLEILSADGVALCLGDVVETTGVVPPKGVVSEVRGILEEQSLGELVVMENLGTRMPSLDGRIGECASLLAVWIGVDSVIILFRRNRGREARWGGNPNSPPSRDPANGSPSREAFAEFVEPHPQLSIPWSEGEIAAATAFQMALSGLVRRRERDYLSLSRQLAAKNDEMESFVYSVSHDLKSPLVTCRGFLGLMLEDIEAGDLDAVKDSAARIDRAVQSLGRLVDALLDLSRIGQKAAAPGRVDIDHLLREMEPDLAERLGKAGARLLIAPEIPPAMVDAIDVVRVFDNLLTNALKYGCPEPGHTIRVGGELLPDQGMVRYCVADDGPGIPPAYHQKIFQLFQRLSSDKDGTGVGLATVAKVARVGGGDAWVESQVGVGSQFFFTLPAPEALSPVDRA